MDNIINIVYVTGALSFGGLERVIINLCKGLNKNYFRPVVVCLKNRGELADEIEREGIKLYSLDANKNRIFKYSTWLKLRKILKNEKIDIVHSHNTASFIDSALATVGTSIKLIHTDHARSFPDKIRYMIAERLASKKANKIVAVSDALKNDLIKYEKISAKKIIIIMNGVESQENVLHNQKLEGIKHIIPSKFKNVIGLGVGLKKQKGITYLIQAAKTIIRQYPETAFLIAGDGPARKELESEVDDLGLRENFIFLGYRKDIPALLTIIDIYVFPSLGEGMPLCILEAMAAKRCIISTDVGGIPKFLKDNDNALLIPPKRPDMIAAKVIYLLKNRELRQKISEKAYVDFKKAFTVDSMVYKYQQLYFQSLGMQIQNNQGHEG